MTNQNDQTNTGAFSKNDAGQSTPPASNASLAPEQPNESTMNPVNPPHDGCCPAANDLSHTPNAFCAQSPCSNDTASSAQASKAPAAADFSADGTDTAYTNAAGSYSEQYPGNPANGAGTFTSNPLGAQNGFAQDTAFSQTPNTPPPLSNTRVCPYCGAPVRERFCGLCGCDTMGGEAGTIPPHTVCTPVAPPRRRAHTGLIVSLSILGVLAVILFVLTISKLQLSPATTLPEQSEEQQTPSSQMTENVGGISAEELQKIQKGMSYAHVSAIIGDDGVLADSGTTVQGETYYTYGWYGENNEDAEVYITFTNDVVSEITVNGEL